MKIFTETDRLVLREIISEDEAGLFEMDSDPEVHRYLGNEPVTSIGQIREVIQFIRKQYADFGIGRWAVVEKETGSFLGWAGLKFRPDEVNGYRDFYEVGYRFMRQNWGKGYATEAARASVKYGFEEMKLPEIHAMADSRNKASRNVLQKCGLKYVNSLEFEGSPHDWFRISREEFFAS